MSTTAERSPCWQPWESRPHIRASAVTASVGGRWVVAASAHPRSGDGGLGVALADAVLDTNIRSIPATPSGRFALQEKWPGAALTAPAVDSPAKEDRRGSE